MKSAAREALRAAVAAVSGLSDVRWRDVSQVYEADRTVRLSIVSSRVLGHAERDGTTDYVHRSTIVQALVESKEADDASDYAELIGLGLEQSETQRRALDAQGLGWQACGDIRDVSSIDKRALSAAVIELYLHECYSRTADDDGEIRHVSGEGVFTRDTGAVETNVFDLDNAVLVEITSPSDGDMVPLGALTVTGTATNTDTVTVTFEGTATEVTVTEGAWTVDLTATIPGASDISASVSDAGQTDEDTITVEVDPPT